MERSAENGSALSRSWVIRHCLFERIGRGLDFCSEVSERRRIDHDSGVGRDGLRRRLRSRRQIGDSLSERIELGRGHIGVPFEIAEKLQFQPNAAADEGESLFHFRAVARVHAIPNRANSHATAAMIQINIM
jgi:hypothetical protein